MLVSCISASNTKLIGEDSASTKVCKLISDIIHEDYSMEIDVNIIPLMDYDIIPCNLCGKCFKNMSCVYDEAFNRFFSLLLKSDAIFFVVPHYSPIPSKLIITFEKINEIVYAGWLNDSEFKFPLNKIPVGIIGHGGMAENDEVLNYYHEHLVTPVARTLKSLSFNVIGANDQFSNGAVFGLKDDTCLRKAENSIFPEIIHDWMSIKSRIKPLVNNIISIKK